MSRPVTIGVFAPYFGGEYLSELLAQMYLYAQPRNVRVLCIRVGDLDIFDLPVASAHIDGWVVVQNAITRAYLEELTATGVPVVSIAHDFGHPLVVSIESDNEGSTAAAVGEMIRAGHRHIAYIGYLTEFDIGRRLAGYCRGLAESNIPYRPEYVLDTEEYGRTGGTLVAQKILAARLPVTAVFAGTDRNAAGAISHFQECGLRVPEDIAVVGYDNTSMAASCSPPLASIDQNLDRIAACAVTVILEQLRAQNCRGGKELVSATFVPRASSGLARASDTHDLPREYTKTGDSSAMYEIGRHLCSVKADSIKPLMKLLSPYLNWRCVAQWDDPVKEPTIVTMQEIYTYRDGTSDNSAIRCDVKEFPPLAAMQKAEQFDPRHAVCVLPILSSGKRLRLFAVSGLIVSLSHVIDLLQYVDLFAPALERITIGENLAAYQSGLEDLVKQRTLELMEAKERAEAANKAKS